MKKKATPYTKTELYEIYRANVTTPVSFNQFCWRLRKGWTEERAITTPARVTAPAKKKSATKSLKKALAKVNGAKVSIDKNDPSMQNIDKATSRLAKGQAKKVELGETKN